MAEKFWADARLEPKRQHRWLLNLDGIDAFVIKTVQKPSFSVSETTHQFFGHQFYYPFLGVGSGPGPDHHSRAPAGQPPVTGEGAAGAGDRTGPVVA